MSPVGGGGSATGTSAVDADEKYMVRGRGGGGGGGAKAAAPEELNKSCPCGPRYREREGIKGRKEMQQQGVCEQKERAHALVGR